MLEGMANDVAKTVAPSTRAARRRGRVRIWAPVVLLVLGLGAGGVWWLLGASERALERLAHALRAQEHREVSRFFQVNGLQRHRKLVVAELDHTYSGEYGNRREWLGLDLGKTAVEFALPVRFFYAVALSEPEAVDFSLDTERRTLAARFPELELLAVETDLGRMDKDLEVGWARSRWFSGAEVDRLYREAVMADLRAYATQTEIKDLAREPARQELAAFVRDYLVARGAWGRDRIDTIVVRFADEPPDYRPPSHSVLRAPRPPTN